MYVLVLLKRHRYILSTSGVSYALYISLLISKLICIKSCPRGRAPSPLLRYEVDFPIRPLEGGGVSGTK
jgi:hypothetical protein